MAIKNSKRFSEVEYCLQKYFNTQFDPLMRNVQSDLSKKQIHEYAEYQMSFGGILRSMANGMNNMPDDSMQYLKLTGEWNSKTTEDYLDMCRKHVAENKDFQKDLMKLSNEWRNTVVKEIGRERYDALSQKLGGDLAYAYVDYRVEQMMIDKLVKDRMPKSSMEYIMRQAGEGSLFGISSLLAKSPLDHEIDAKGEKAYNPHWTEKGVAKASSIAIDAVATGGCGSWASLGKFAGAEIVFSGVGHLLDKNGKGEKVRTVEDCISESVFGSNTNVFSDFRKKSQAINSWENNYVLSFNKTLNKKMGIATEKPFYMDVVNPANSLGKKPWDLSFIGISKSKKDYSNVPFIIAPGHEEEYLAQKKQQDAQAKVEAERAKAEKSKQSNSDFVEPKSAMEAYNQNHQNGEAAQQQVEQSTEMATQGNAEGWSELLSSIGLDGLGAVGTNLGYIISMLPDVLIGMFTGRNTTFGKKDTMMPIASILAGIFVKNPILKMSLIGLGGANLLNKAGHEAIERHEGSSQVKGRMQYRPYADEALNPRIQSPILQGNCLIANIDRVPCTIQLPPNVVSAYEAGALPLNTLSNAILAKNDQMSNIAQNNYRNVEGQSEERDRTVALK